MAAKNNGGKSKLPPKINAKRNTQAGRKAMSPSSFGLPTQKKYRIDDPAHARDALARVAQHGSPTEQKQVQQRVAKKYPGINVTGVKKPGKKK